MIVYRQRNTNKGQPVTIEHIADIDFDLATFLVGGVLPMPAV